MCAASALRGGGGELDKGCGTRRVSPFLGLSSVDCGLLPPPSGLGPGSHPLPRGPFWLSCHQADPPSSLRFVPLGSQVVCSRGVAAVAVRVWPGRGVFSLSLSLFIIRFPLPCLRLRDGGGIGTLRSYAINAINSN